MSEHRPSAGYPRPPREPVLVDGVTMWRCTKCVGVFPPEGFYAGRNRNGLMSQCRKCHTRQTNAARERNPDKRRAYARQWVKKDLAAHPEKYARRERERRHNPATRQRALARKKLTTHVARGKLIKPDTCSQCGGDGDGRPIHGHHADYSKPLDVEWLCFRCHAMRHGHRVSA